jgi:hypothetical protein
VVVVVGNEELTARPGDDLDRVLFELPAFTFRVLGDTLLLIGDLLHSHGAL